ncbi:MAG: hypothetical protein ABH817_02560 [archaeon]
MAIVGFNFNKILIEKKKVTPSGQINVNSGINIKDVSKEDVKLVKDKDTLSFSFEFTINYTPDIAKLEFEGELMYLADNKQAKEILDFWKKNKKIKEEIEMPVLNTILTRCNIKALTMENDLGLPTHIRLPYVDKKNNNNNKNIN